MNVSCWFSRNNSSFFFLFQTFNIYNQLPTYYITCRHIIKLSFTVLLIKIVYYNSLKLPISCRQFFMIYISEVKSIVEKKVLPTYRPSIFVVVKKETGFYFLALLRIYFPSRLLFSVIFFSLAFSCYFQYFDVVVLLMFLFSQYFLLPFLLYKLQSLRRLHNCTAFPVVFKTNFALAILNIENLFISFFYLFRLTEAHKTAIRVLRKLKYFVARRKFQVTTKTRHLFILQNFLDIQSMNNTYDTIHTINT